MMTSRGTDRDDDDIIEYLKALRGGMHSDAGESGGGGAGGDDNVMEFSSVSDADKATTGPAICMAVNANRRHMSNIAKWVSQNAESLSGDAHDWHNLANAYMREEDYANALAIVSAGLDRFPNYATLLGDAIWCCGHTGNWELGDKLLRQVEGKDCRADEDWSLAVYVADYCNSRALSMDEASRSSIYDEAISFIESAIEKLGPTDRLYNAEAEVLLQSGRKDDARSLLEGVIFRKDSMDDGIPNPRRVPVPQCCITYLEDILADSCDYDLIIRVSNEGLRFSATVDRHVSTEYFVYRKALAMDAQLYSRPNGYREEQFVREAMRLYALAHSLEDDDSTHRKTCEERFSILGAMGGVSDLSINQFENDQE